MSHDFSVKPLEKPAFYSDAEWEEIQLLKKKATDKFVNLWILRQANPYLMKQKIDPTDLEHVLDFFNSDSNEKPPRLGKISYLEAVRQANRWTELENKRVRRKLEFKEDPNDTELVFEYGKDRWVRLVNQKAYEREGANMNHCVGRGGYQNSIIYSLRDEENEPHCTIEVNGNKVKQIKGKTNQLVVHRYHKSVFAFLAFLGIQIDSYDLDKYGFIVCKQGTYDANTLPDEVELLNDRKLQLGVNSRIPKKLKGSHVEIDTRRDLDLSQWEVSRLTVKTSNNRVKLPANVKELTIENSVIKEKRISGASLSLIDSSVTAEEVNFESASLKNSLIDSSTCTILKVRFAKNDNGFNKSKINSEQINLYELSTKDENIEGDIFNSLISDKINIEHKFEVYFDKTMEEKLKKVSLGKNCKLTIKNPNSVPFKINWESLYQIELNGTSEVIDFSNLKSLNAYKEDSGRKTRFVMGMMIKGESEPVNILPVILNKKHNLIMEKHYYEVVAPNKAVS